VYSSLYLEFWLADFEAQKQDHVYKRPPQSTNFIFQKTFENFSHEVFGLVGSNLWVIIMRKRIRKGGIDTIHILSQETIYSCEESRAYWQWKARGVVAAVILCRVLKGTSAIFFSIEDSSTIRYKMNIWIFRDCMARMIGVFCEPIKVLSARDTWCRCRINQLQLRDRVEISYEWGKVLVVHSVPKIHGWN